jgi:hypothetical protein
VISTGARSSLLDHRGWLRVAARSPGAAVTVRGMIEVTGTNGESLLFDGATVAKYRHHGKDEAARNPVSTYREVRIKHKGGKRGREGTYEVMLAMSSFMALSVPESGKADLDALVAALDATRSG